MSSFTSAASLKRRCLLPSPDQQYIISAHGPFIETFDVLAWQSLSVDLKKQPSRLKLFSDLGAYIETILPLGSTWYFVAISNILKDNVHEELRVYGTIIHWSEIIQGGYADSSRIFVVSSQPWNESPCMPKLAVVRETCELLVLTGSSINVFKCNDGYAVKDESISFKTFPKAIKGLKPVIVLPSIPLQFIMVDDYNHVVVVNHVIEKGILKWNPHKEWVVKGAVTAACIVNDMNALLIADEKELHLLTYPSNVTPPLEQTRKGAHSDVITPIEEQILELEVKEGPTSGSKIIVALSQTKVSFYRLDDTMTLMGEMDCKESCFTSCTIIPPPGEDASLLDESFTRDIHPAHLLYAKQFFEFVLENDIECMHMAKHMSSFIDHLLECKEIECSKYQLCLLFRQLFSLSFPSSSSEEWQPVTQLLLIRLLESSHDEWESLIMETISKLKELKASMETNCPSETRRDGNDEMRINERKFDLLALASDNGEVKVVHAYSYMDQSKESLSSPSDSATEIVSFFPSCVFVEGEMGMGSLEGVYAVTAATDFIYRTRSGNDVTPVVTKTITSGLVDLSSYTTRSGKVSLVAYGRQSMHVYRMSLNLKIDVKDAPSLLSTESSISECFAHASHFLIVTGDGMGLVNMGVTDTEARGIPLDLIELDGIHNISSYGAIYGKDGEADLQLSIVGTSNGRVYSMQVNEGEMYDDEYDDIQDLLDCEPSNEFLFEEALSAPFLESENERIVSTATRIIDGRTEMMILGVKGSIVRFSYQRGKEFVLLEVHKANCELEHFLFRSLTPIRGMNEVGSEFPLIVAYESVKNSVGIQYILIHLLHFQSRDILFTASADRISSANLHSSGHVHIYRSERGEGDKITLFSLHSSQTAKKKAYKDTFTAFEGVLRRSARDEVVHTTAFRNWPISLHISSMINENGNRAAFVVTVNCDWISAARLSSASKLIPLAETDMRPSEYEPRCSGIVTTLSGSYVLIGCEEGEIMIIQRPEIDGSLIVPTVLLTETKFVEDIYQIAPFSASDSEIEKDGLMFAVLTGDCVRVYLQRLDKVGTSIEVLQEWKIQMNGEPDEYALYSMGTRMATHDVWLCSKKEIVMWRGKEGSFERKEHRVDLRMMRGGVTASAAIPVHSEYGEWEIPMVNVVCVGTKKGNIGWFYTIHAKDCSYSIQHTMLDGVGCDILDLEGMVTRPMYNDTPTSTRFEACVYVLTSVRVIVKFVKVHLKLDGLVVSQMAEHCLHHVVNDPFILSIEKSIRPTAELSEHKFNDKPRRHDLPQRIIVAGEDEMETLIMCPKILYQMEPDLEVIPLVKNITRGKISSKHLLRNNTDYPIHVEKSDGSTTPIVDHRSSSFIAFHRDEETRKNESYTVKYRMKKDGEEDERGEVLLYVKDV